MNDRLLTMLKKLRLSGLAQTLEVRLQEAAGHQLSHAEFLELILQDELLVRNERLIGRRVKSAAFRELKPLDDFDWSFNPSINRKQVYDGRRCHSTSRSAGGMSRGAANRPTGRSRSRAPGAGSITAASKQEKHSGDR
ncbi:MAG: ATP-binding protein [Planctomycetes bacterium]|nr:ATP-binding protein [Planctomycetota bacterium]